MNLIKKYKKWIVITFIVSAVLNLWTTVIGPGTGMIKLDGMNPFDLFLIVLPGYIFCISFLLLLYYLINNARPRKKDRTVIYYVQIVCFWSLAVLMTLYWVFFTRHFIL